MVVSSVIVFASASTITFGASTLPSFQVKDGFFFKDTVVRSR